MLFLNPHSWTWGIKQQLGIQPKAPPRARSVRTCSLFQKCAGSSPLPRQLCLEDFQIVFNTRCSMKDVDSCLEGHFTLGEPRVQLHTLLVHLECTMTLIPVTRGRRYSTFISWQSVTKYVICIAAYCELTVAAALMGFVKMWATAKRKDLTGGQRRYQLSAMCGAVGYHCCFKIAALL